ncbi:MAG TPA: YceI family protein [Longimicrobiaceae bacterium]|nr:YceI family protein [Longimicrobiaceae bacterium]
MGTRLPVVIVLVTVLAPAALAGPASLTILPGSRLWVQGTTSVRSYTCRAARVDGMVTTLPGSTRLDIAALETVVGSAEVSVAVAELKCGNPVLDAQVRRALQEDVSPRITYRITAYEVTPSGDGEGTVRLDGVLRIAGTEKPVGIDATAQVEPGRLRVRGSTQFNMTEFGVQPPAPVMGAMRVNDPVAVRFDLLLKP